MAAHQAGPPTGALPTDAVDQLGVLVARAQIHDAVMRYCRGIDRADLALVQSAFWDDAVDDHTGTAVASRELNVHMVDTVLARFSATTHLIGNELVEVDLEAATARSESYFLAVHRFHDDGQPADWVLSGRYLDQFAERNGEWRILVRRCAYDWWRVDPVADRAEAGSPAASLVDALRGERSVDDPVYRWTERS